MEFSINIDEHPDFKYCLFHITYHKVLLSMRRHYCGIIFYVAVELFIHYGSICLFVVKDIYQNLHINDG